MALRVRASTISRTVPSARRQVLVLCVPTILGPRPPRGAVVQGSQGPLSLVWVAPAHMAGAGLLSHLHLYTAMRVPNASRIAFEALRQVEVLRTTPCRVRRRCSGRVQVSHAGRVSHGARRGAGWLGQCQDGRCGSAVMFDPIEREHPQHVMRVLKWQEVPPEVGTHARKRRVAKASASMRVAASYPQFLV